eukprot:9552309-Prorocentrum_lima.AAC.1
MLAQEVHELDLVPEEQPALLIDLIDASELGLLEEDSGIKDATTQCHLRVLRKVDGGGCTGGGHWAGACSNLQRGLGCHAGCSCGA